MTAEARVIVSHWTFAIQLGNMSAIMSLLKHVVLAISKTRKDIVYTVWVMACTVIIATAGC